MSEQIAVRIPDELAESLEELVATGRFETKADAVRTALDALIDAERRRRVGELIAEGYRKVPQDDDEIEAATAAAIRSIREGRGEHARPGRNLVGRGTGRKGAVLSDPDP